MAIDSCYGYGLNTLLVKGKSWLGTHGLDSSRNKKTRVESWRVHEKLMKVKKIINNIIINIIIIIIMIIMIIIMIINIIIIIIIMAISNEKSTWHGGENSRTMGPVPSFGMNHHESPIFVQAHRSRVHLACLQGLQMELSFLQHWKCWNLESTRSRSFPMPRLVIAAAHSCRFISFVT